MHLMLQREVVERMVSKPGSRTYGRLGVMVQLDCEVEHVLDVGRDAFSPAPRVESSVVRLRPRKNTALDAASRDRFDTIVRSCFSKRRKTLRNALSGLCSEPTIIAASLDPQSRPETLTIDAFKRLTIAQHGPGMSNSAGICDGVNHPPHTRINRVPSTGPRSRPDRERADPLYPQILWKTLWKTFDSRPFILEI